KMKKMNFKFQTKWLIAAVPLTLIGVALVVITLNQKPKVVFPHAVITSPKTTFKVAEKMNFTVDLKEKKPGGFGFIPAAHASDNHCSGSSTSFCDGPMTVTLHSDTFRKDVGADLTISDPNNQSFGIQIDPGSSPTPNTTQYLSSQQKDAVKGLRPG